ncbi:MAG: geranylgeranyl reductase family protein [Anaerolineae bacterium]|nr:geranylgeranyl reductase family protein [Anaerolineae bacterium]
MVTLNEAACCYCGGCVSTCPVDAIFLAETRLRIAETCTDCGLCVQACPVGALSPQPESPIGHGLPARAQYDVVVVGAGPGGSVAAWKVAEAGLSTLLVEKRQEIGSPVRCAEGLAREPLERFLDPDPRWIAARVTKAQIVARGNGNEDRRLYEGGEGFILERRVFDRALAEAAAQAGAEVRVKVAAVGLVRDGSRVVGVRLRDASGRTREVACHVVIGADGVESQVGRWAGIRTLLRLRDAMACAQYLLAGVAWDADCCGYWVDEEIAPGGYAWVFPKGEGRANVGLGIQADLTQETALALLHRFIEGEPALSQGRPVTLVTGVVPVALPPSSFVGDGLMLVGDAARQVDPLTGGGIANAMEAGALAAQVAAEAVAAGDPSAARLRAYEEAWQEGTGKAMAKRYRLRERYPPSERTSPGFLRIFGVAVGGK